ncbi:hypothetical protein Trydic_g20861 [Trypoxylus dichotomus]
MGASQFNRESKVTLRYLIWGRQETTPPRMVNSAGSPYEWRYSTLQGVERVLKAAVDDSGVPGSRVNVEVQVDGCGGQDIAAVQVYKRDNIFFLPIP